MSRRQEIQCATKYVVAGREFNTKFEAELYLQAVHIADAAEELNGLFEDGRLQDVGKALYLLNIGTCQYLVGLANVISAAARELLDMRQLEATSAVAVEERGES